MEVTRLQDLSDAVAAKASEAAKVYQELGELLAALGKALGDMNPDDHKRSRGRAWTEPEDTIVRDTYARLGSAATANALLVAGFPKRSIQSIQTRAKVLKATGAPRYRVHDRIVEVVRAFGGLPASLDDVVDEAGVRLSRKRARACLDELVGNGVLAVRESDDGLVWFDPNALSEAA